MSALPVCGVHIVGLRRLLFGFIKFGTVRKRVAQPRKVVSSVLPVCTQEMVPEQGVFNLVRLYCSFISITIRIYSPRVDYGTLDNGLG